MKSWQEKGCDSPLCYYKKVGVSNDDTSDTAKSSFTSKDFLLVIQMPSQCEILRSNERTLCVDATHGVTGYGYYLLTILVVDIFGQGYPIGWCITSRENGLIWNIFALSLKKKTGHVSPQVLMADDDNSAWNGLRAVWPSLKYKLLCHWHVKKNVRQHCVGSKCKVQVTLHTPYEHAMNNLAHTVMKIKKKGTMNIPMNML